MLVIKDFFSKFSQLKRIHHGEKLGVEIAIIMVIKIVLLWLIWWLCFSQPINKEVRQHAVTKILLTPSR